MNDYQKLNEWIQILFFHKFTLLMKFICSRPLDPFIRIVWLSQSINFVSSRLRQIKGTIVRRYVPIKGFNLKLTAHMKSTNPTAILFHSQRVSSNEFEEKKMSKNKRLTNFHTQAM